jgi:hypothetical protein
VNDSGPGAYSATGAFQTGSEISAVGDEPSIARTTALLQNYPNPFNPTTTIDFDVASECQVRIDVSDVLGRTVATLVNGSQRAGRHSVVFDASGLPSGAYFYRMLAGTAIAVRKLAIVR